MDFDGKDFLEFQNFQKPFTKPPLWRQIDENEWLETYKCFCFCLG